MNITGTVPWARVLNTRHRYLDRYAGLQMLPGQGSEMLTPWFQSRYRYLADQRTGQMTVNNAEASVSMTGLPPPLLLTAVLLLLAVQLLFLSCVLATSLRTGHVRVIAT